jgi:hypothetical protein
MTCDLTRPDLLRASDLGNLKPIVSPIQSECPANFFPKFEQHQCSLLNRVTDLDFSLRHQMAIDATASRSVLQTGQGRWPLLSHP